MYVFGGRGGGGGGGGGNALVDLYEYDIAGRSWAAVEVSWCPAPRYFSAAADVEGAMHVFGGERREQDSDEHLAALCTKHRLEFLCITVDLRQEDGWDMMGPDTQGALLRLADDWCLDILNAITGDPCTESASKYSPAVVLQPVYENYRRLAAL